MKQLFLSIAQNLLSGPVCFSRAQNKKSDSALLGQVRLNGEYIPFTGNPVNTTTDATSPYHSLRP